MRMSAFRKKWLPLALLVPLVAATTAGCGGDNKDDSGSKAETSTTVDASVLGQKDPATGAAVKIGFLYDGTTEAIDNGPDLVAAQAATSYVNDYLGGLGGRKLELDVCAPAPTTTSTTATTIITTTTAPARVATPAFTG